MSDAEFDLLDELYFVQPFSYLQETLAWEDHTLIETLDLLYQEGLIKCLQSPDVERFDQVNIVEEGRNLYFLATKKGLMAHNAL
jgi:DNA-binding MarR family transcriptional regulator